MCTANFVIKTEHEKGILLGAKREYSVEIGHILFRSNTCIHICYMHLTSALRHKDIEKIGYNSDNTME